MIEPNVSISVVMSCYHGDTLRNLTSAVNSVLFQTIKFQEFVIVIDGPVNQDIDNFLSRLEKENDSIVVYRLELNCGAARARNFGIRHSSGDIIAIMDSDDILLPNRLEMQLKAMLSKDVDAVWAWQEEFYDGTNKFGGIKQCPENHDEIIKKLKYRCLLPDPTTFIKRACFEKTKGYAEFENINIDYKFFLEMALCGCKFYCVQTPLIRVRISAAQRRRRGGVYLLRQDYKLRKWMRETKIISSLEMYLILIIFAMFRLSPNFIRDIIYKFILRK